MGKKTSDPVQRLLCLFGLEPTFGKACMVTPAISIGQVPIQNVLSSKHLLISKCPENNNVIWCKIPGDLQCQNQSKAK